MTIEKRLKGGYRVIALFEDSRVPVVKVIGHWAVLARTESPLIHLNTIRSWIVKEGINPLRYDYHWSVEGGNADNLGSLMGLDNLVAKWAADSTAKKTRLNIDKAEREYRAHNGEKGLLP